MSPAVKIGAAPLAACRLLSRTVSGRWHRAYGGRRCVPSKWVGRTTSAGVRDVTRGVLGGTAGKYRAALSCADGRVGGSAALSCADGRVGGSATIRHLSTVWECETVEAGLAKLCPDQAKLSSLLARHTRGSALKRGEVRKIEAGLVQLCPDRTKWPSLLGSGSLMSAIVTEQVDTVEAGLVQLCPDRTKWPSLLGTDSLMSALANGGVGTLEAGLVQLCPDRTKWLSLLGTDSLMCALANAEVGTLEAGLAQLCTDRTKWPSLLGIGSLMCALANAEVGTLESGLVQLCPDRTKWPSLLGTGSLMSALANAEVGTLEAGLAQLCPDRTKWPSLLGRDSLMSAIVTRKVGTLEAGLAQLCPDRTKWPSLLVTGSLVSAISNGYAPLLEDWCVKHLPNPALRLPLLGKDVVIACILRGDGDTLWDCLEPYARAGLPLVSLAFVFPSAIRRNCHLQLQECLEASGVPPSSHPLMIRCMLKVCEADKDRGTLFYAWARDSVGISEEGLAVFCSSQMGTFYVDAKPHVRDGLGSFLDELKVPAGSRHSLFAHTSLSSGHALKLVASGGVTFEALAEGLRAHQRIPLTKLRGYNLVKGAGLAR